ncbi:MAG TPA: VOC family protein [Actinomycetota bacterium]|nr:VOC family protein [Actinomycetota bacterium]
MQTAQTHLADSTTVGMVELTVAGLDRSIGFYSDRLGLEVLDRNDAWAAMGVADTELLRLQALPGARRSYHATGLYHFAVRVPDRHSLARWLARAIELQTPIDGASDHYVSEAIYLHDPDGHGIEIYADRPRRVWEGRLSEMGALRALNIRDLLAQLDGTEPPMTKLPPGTDMGHIHLQVRDIPETIAFYRDVVGFDLTMEYGDSAAFFSAGGYHHHIGTNTWHSKGAGPSQDDTAALQFATIVLDSEEERRAVVERVRAAGHDAHVDGDDVLIQDPSGISLRLDWASR